MTVLRRCLQMLGLPTLAAFGFAAALPALANDVPTDSPVAEALRKAEAAVAAIVSVPAADRTFDNTVGAIDDLLVRLRLETEFTQFMAYVSTDAAERERGRLAEEHVQNWLITLSKRVDLYEAVKAYAATEPQLAGEQARLLQHTLRDYRRAGMELPAEQRARLQELELEENRLVLEFQKNLRDDETRLPFTGDELRGVPEAVLTRLPRSGDLFLVGLDSPTYMAVQTFGEVENTRQKLYVSYKRLGGKRNVDLLERILKLRAQQAQLLGYPNIAAYVTEVRMAKSPETVLKFYEELRPVIRRKATADFAEFTAAKREHTGNPEAQVQAWDQFFYENWLKRTRYAVDGEKVQEYFPMDRVVQAVFDITQELFGLEYRDVTSTAAAGGRPIWHPDVKLYEVWDRAKQELLGEFYFDPYPRDNKYGHFAQFGLFPRKVWADGSVQRPLVALVCNFPPPSQERPALMTHSDVETYFHEFGHALHSLLTAVEYGSFSGTATALDFVELPSQMLENWVWDGDVLRTFAHHYKTGDPLPDDVLAAMLAARNVGSGITAERQVLYGLTDLRYHLSADGAVDSTALGLATWAETELFPPVPETYFQAGFGHLMHYHAGYYGYLWSKVYAQDMFAYFQEHGLLNPDAGQFYRQHVLSRGGAQDEMEMLKAFLGREPRLEPFLEHLGMDAVSSTQ
ncbi:MAG: Zn-dependent oligopeptidase [Phycisphaerales bacterium]|nr:Zn-dependent oligopeptidase [Phycisphaerales bacterium]